MAKPEWIDPLDTSYSKQTGGRWNPQGAFGALFLNKTIEVAAANARQQHRGRAIGLFDLRPERRPILVEVDVPPSAVLDVVTPDGVKALRLPATYPFAVGHDRCQPIGRRAYATGLSGIACRSNAEATRSSWLGEELVWFDRSSALEERGPRRKFADWYPDSIPPSGR